MNKNVYKYDDSKRSQHMAVRTTVGWYLWTHQLVEVTGEDAAAFLDLIFTNNIATLKVGSDRYTTMLNNDAEIIDDVVVIRLEEQKFWISTLFATKMMAWLEDHKGNRKVSWEHVTDQYHMFAVQGPKSLEMINLLVAEKVDDQKFFTIRDNTIDGIPVKINRAGFTGEKLGYEIYISRDKYKEMLGKLAAAAEKVGGKQVTEFQIMTWTLPTEAGYYYMRELMHTNPFEVGLTRGINWDKEFIGKEALLKIKEEGPEREMLGFTMEEADVNVTGAEMGNSYSKVTRNGEEIGGVMKCNYSYVQEKPVGYILVEKGSVKIGDHVTLNRHYDAVVTEKSFL